MKSSFTRRTAVLALAAALVLSSSASALFGGKTEQPEAEEEDAYGVATEKDEYTDRSPAGFSFEEALHPKDDLEDIMRDLGLIMDD